MAKKKTISIYVDIKDGVLQSVYAPKEDLENVNMLVYKMDYDDLAAEAADEESEEYMASRAEFDVYEEQIDDGTLVSVW